ncbi:MAG: hypothetical protein Udaeo2_34400 [Candidatus Udaeobacter sp.]|nr:MAG: hypothetical protein Udaeo2_34400 [Candidatus Udaeobacter sp.]
MKISFPKYGIDELLTQKRLATCIISFVALAVFAGALGSYLLGNKFWLLMIAVLGIAGILLWLGAAAAISLSQSKVDEAPSAPIEENAPQITYQWDYRPRKPIRARRVLESPGTKTSDDLSSDVFVTNGSVWSNDDSDKGATPAFISDPPHAEEPIPKALSQTSDPVSASPTVDDEASEVRLKSYRQSNRRR